MKDLKNITASQTRMEMHTVNGLISEKPELIILCLNVKKTAEIATIAMSEMVPHTALRTVELARDNMLPWMSALTTAIALVIRAPTG